MRAEYPMVDFEREKICLVGGDGVGGDVGNLT